MNRWWRRRRSHTLACFGRKFRVSRDLFTDLTAGTATVRTFLPRLLTAASRIQNCSYRKIITYQTPQSNLPIVTTNPDRSILITIITWHFQFRPMNISILHLKYEHRAWSESRFACYSHRYVTWCPLMTEIVASQFPSSRDATLVTRCLTPFISTCLISLKQFLPQQNILTKNLQT